MDEEVDCIILSASKLSNIHVDGKLSGGKRPQPGWLWDLIPSYWMVRKPCKPDSSSSEAEETLESIAIFGNFHVEVCFLPGLPRRLRPMASDMKALQT
eukprot:Skav227314  [mRNA]  locus=scaffold826:42220:46452:- [translate_table: standard]